MVDAVIPSIVTAVMLSSSKWVHDHKRSCTASTTRVCVSRHKITKMVSNTHTEYQATALKHTNRIL